MSRSSFQIDSCNSHDLMYPLHVDRRHKHDCVCSYNRSFKALVKLPSLVKSLQQLSSTHGITPLLEVFVPQLVSTGVKNMLTEQQSDFYMRPLLEISLELLNEIEFEHGLVITIGRSVLWL